MKMRVANVIELELKSSNLGFFLYFADAHLQNSEYINSGIERNHILVSIREIYNSSKTF